MTTSSQKYQSLVGLTLEEAQSQASTLGASSVKTITESEATSFDPEAASQGQVYAIMDNDGKISQIIDTPED